MRGSYAGLSTGLLDRAYGNLSTLAVLALLVGFTLGHCQNSGVLHEPGGTYASLAAGLFNRAHRDLGALAVLALLVVLALHGRQNVTSKGGTRRCLHKPCHRSSRQSK